VATRIGKRHTLTLALGAALAGNLIKWFCYTPAQPLLFLLPPLFVAFGFSALWTLTASMLADVCDLHELNTGNRNEGALNAMYAWVLKAGTTLAFALSGLLLNLTGFDQALGAGQSAGTILSMRWMARALHFRLSGSFCYGRIIACTGRAIGEFVSLV